MIIISLVPIQSSWMFNQCLNWCGERFSFYEHWVR